MQLRVFVFCIVGALVFHFSKGQPFTNLVFEGAGIRGYAYVGVIQELEQHDLMSDVEKVAGTSAGAIAALTVALGYNSEEIADIMSETRPQKFNDGQFFFIGGIMRMNKRYGWYKGDEFTRWIEKIIEAKTGDPDITFRQLRARGFRSLYVTGTSLNRQALIIFSHETFPEMKVKDAVRISISIPYYFAAVPVDSIGNVLKKHDDKNVRDLMVDGGFTGNFPIFIFDSVKVANNGHERISNMNTIGFRIDNPEQIRYDTTTHGLAPVEIRGFKNYTSAFYNYTIENLNRLYLTPADWQRTISISSGNIGPRIRKLSEEEKRTLITNGRNATKRFLRNKAVDNN